jgi:hypothetical protein
MLHSSCQNLLSQERKELQDNKVSNLQKLEAASVEIEEEAAGVAASVEAVEHQEVVVDLEVEQEEEVEEEAPQEEEGEAIDSYQLLPHKILTLVN